MRVIHLVADNLKRLRAVDITPPDHLVVVSGPNGAGKSSVLDAIWLALAGKDAAKSTGTTRPIRDGAPSASVTLDLGDMTVTRRWTDNNSNYLTVTAKDGTRYPSPQAVLDRLMGRLSFDPLAFLHLRPRDQVEALLDALKLPIDIPALDSRRAELYDRRTIVGRERDRAKGAAESIPPPPPDLPAEECSASDILAQLQTNADLQAKSDRLLRELELSIEAVDRSRIRVERLEAELRQAQSEWTTNKVLMDSLAEQVSSIDVPDPAPLKKRLSEIERINADVRQQRQRADFEQRASQLAEEYDGLTRQISEIDATKSRAIRESRLPIAGLSFTTDGVLYNDLPLAQASHAEQLKVSLAVAMAANPTLRIIRITDGSLLDSSNMALIEQIARDQDYQVWMERVDDGGGVGIRIEDGTVGGGQR